MMSAEQDQRLEAAFFPAIRRAVPFRAERNGGYIMTAHSGGIADLSSVELNVARLCNGQNPVTAIITQIAQATDWPRPTAQGATWSALRRFQSIGALEWRMEPAREPYFPDFSLPTAEDDALLGRALVAPLSVLWDITYACNLRCTHCLTGSGTAASDELSAEQAEAVLDQLLAAKVFSLTFCGGEPLLSPHLFALVEQATSHGMDVSLDTNGMLVDMERARRLAALGVASVQVSIDGREDTHDRFRGKAGSFQAAVSAVRIFCSLGFNVSISTMLTAATHQDLDYVGELAVELGVAGLKASLFLPTGRGQQNRRDLTLHPAQARAGYMRLLDLQERAGPRLKVALEGVYPLLDDVGAATAPRVECGAGSEVGCPAGTSQIVIGANGLVYACPFLYGHPAGDLRKSRLADIWREASIFRFFRQTTKGQLQGRCRTCAYLPEKCRGGCRAAAYAIHGDLYAEDPMCWCGAERRSP
jgi:radical SAM protein with 4Fe4S-binding SPASM domain